MKKIVAAAKKGLLAVISDEALYLFVAFMFATVLQSNLFRYEQEKIQLLREYFLIPWSLSLGLLRFMRADETTLMKKDTGLLTLMFLWVIVPFYLRFGITFNNVTSWYGHAAVFFAVYCMTREEEKSRRDAQLDRITALFALVSLVWGGLMLMCAVTGIVYATDNINPDHWFGVYWGKLQMGMDYNLTAMPLVCMLMMCMTGLSRRKSWLGRILYLVPTVVIGLCLILTQSNTARYAVVIAFAAGVYGAVYARLGERRMLPRQLAALAAALLTMVVSFWGASAITAAAVDHYNGISTIVAKAEEAPLSPQDLWLPPPEVRNEENGIGERLIIWNNVLKLWKDNPRHMIIGRGVGNVGRYIVQGTIHEHGGAIAVHNTYLQLLADFGLIGGLITLAFLLTVFFPALRVFLAPVESGFAGGRALCMLVVAVLATGMMESQPLGANTPMNMMLYYALALLCAEGQRIKKRGA